MLFPYSPVPFVKLSITPAFKQSVDMLTPWSRIITTRFLDTSQANRLFKSLRLGLVYHLFTHNKYHTITYLADINFFGGFVLIL